MDWLYHQYFWEIFFLEIVLLIMRFGTVFVYWNYVVHFDGCHIIDSAAIIRHISLTSDDPNFKKIQKAILSSDWKENTINIVENRLEKKE